MWPIHTVEYYPALQRREDLIRVTPWMNLEDYVNSNVKFNKLHTQQNKYCMILLA